MFSFVFTVVFEGKQKFVCAADAAGCATNRENLT